MAAYALALLINIKLYNKCCHKHEDISFKNGFLVYPLKKVEQEGRIAKCINSFHNVTINQKYLHSKMSQMGLR